MRLFARVTNISTGEQWEIYHGVNYIKIIGRGWLKTLNWMRLTLDPRRLPK